MSKVISEKEAKRVISGNVERFLGLRGMSQAELARKTGDSEMRVSHARHGKRCPSAAFLSRLAEALGCTIDDLLDKSS